MDRGEPRRNDSAAGFRRAREPESVAVASDTRRESIELSQLRVLCIGIAGSIAADALILICFRVI
jgi:hypothetical protein